MSVKIPKTDTEVKTQYESNSDTNAFTDAEKTLLGNQSGTNTGDQTGFSTTFSLSGDISPSQITANQNDYNPTGLATSAVLRLNSDASRNITGLQGGADGRVLVIHNVGSNDIVLTNEDANSTAANRFALTADATISADQMVLLQYDSTSERWRMISGGGGGDVSTSGTPVDNDFAKFTDATTIEGRSYSEVRSDLNVEDGADVTDTANVTSAGALMDSELTDLVGIKSLDTSTLALKSNVLELDNTDAFTPDADYEPATKKYVDDEIDRDITTHTAITDAHHAKYTDAEAVSAVEAGTDVTFSTFPITPSSAPDANYEVANKKYVDDNAGGGGTPGGTDGQVQYNNSGSFGGYARATGAADNNIIATKGYVDDNAGGGGTSSAEELGYYANIPIPLGIPIKYGSNPIITVGGAGAWNEKVIAPTGGVRWDNNTSKWIMFAEGWESDNTKHMGVYYADTIDGAWTEYASNPVMSKGGSGDPDEDDVRQFCVIWEPKNSQYRCYYCGRTPGGYYQILTATSPDGITWTKNATVIVSNGASDVYGPSVVLTGHKYVMLWLLKSTFVNYMYESSDGVNFSDTNLSPISQSPSQTWDSARQEFQSFFFDSGIYYIIASGFDSGAGKYTVGITLSDGNKWTYIKDDNNPIIDTVAGTWESAHTALARMIKVGDTFYIFYGGHNGSNWQVGRAKITNY